MARYNTVMSADNIIHICSTARLSLALQTALQQAQLNSGAATWQTPHVHTLPQFLADYCMHSALAGEITAEKVPTIALSPFAEKLLWQQSIEDALEKHEYKLLFDTASLADAAMQANKLLIHWRIDDAAINHDYLTVETRQFLRWRAIFTKLCLQHHTADAASLMALQINQFGRSDLPLPTQIKLHGFDRITPLEQRLLDTLKNKGVVIEIQQPQAVAANVTSAQYLDIAQECRAAVAWAQAILTQNSQAKLAIIAPNMHQIRRLLADLLDDTFHPQTLHANQAETPRIYDFSLGLALNKQPMIACAFNCLRLCCHNQAQPQANFSQLLLDVFWGATAETDMRAMLDARMRQTLPVRTSLKQLQNLVQKHHANSQLFAHLHAILAFSQSHKSKQLPSYWASAFATILNQINWAQSRALSSVEYQANQKWQAMFLDLSALDHLLGNLRASEALSHLQALCSSHMFQAQAEKTVQIQVLGILESPEKVLDGVWVLGMNDHIWPPPPRANPLLPITLQRAKAMPGADANTQTIFAKQVFKRLTISANQVVFSHAHAEGDRELRPSPLLENGHLKTVKYLDILSNSKEQTVRYASNSLQTMAERMAQPINLQRLNDASAPAITALDNIKGGVKLLAAQAVCPAWAFYQYRLGARKLENPSEGLDQLLRGNLVHAALQHFWQTCQNQANLLAMSPAELQTAMTLAIQTAISQDENAPFLSAQLRNLEQNRLLQLLQLWLDCEKTRTPFSIKELEAERELQVQGITIKCRLDRIDETPDGLIVIDYKTGAEPKTAPWAEDRLSDPQLPFYASIVLQNEKVIAACFARVNVEECALTGAAGYDIGAGLKPIAELSSQNKLKQFGDFDALLTHWRQNITQIADEIAAGVADVRFNKEADLEYCDVTPLLRLPERQLQFELSKVAE